MLTRILPLFAILALTAAAGAQPLTTAFTYQAELRNAGAPATGPHDLRFRLYDAVSGGTQQGPTLCADNVLVAQGRFTTLLDFGAQFAGQQRFLEIEVRADTGQDCANIAGFTILGPRQELSAAPNAAFALSSATATNATQLNGQSPSFYTNAANLTGTLPSGVLGGSYSAALTLNNTGNSFAGSGAGLINLSASNLSTGTMPDARLSTNIPRLNGANAFGNFSNSFLGSVGIGTAAPAAPLHVKGTGEGVRIQGAGAGAVNVAWMEFRDSAGTRTGYVGDGSSSDSSLYLTSDAGDVHLYTVLGAAVTAKASGNVGIGTTTPSAKLDIQGSSNSNVLFARRTGGGLSHNLFIEGSGDGGMQILDSTGTPRIQFRSGDNTFLNYGSVGIGTTSTPIAKLDVRGAAVGVYGDSNSSGGVGVFGNGGNGDGVQGQNTILPASNYGVFAFGRMGASGTKTFRIDHPADPENKYLQHYSSEAPEPQNFYNGVATLDDRGETVVELPAYFAAINKNPRYTLTAMGQAMPLLHIAGEIDGAALDQGARTEPGQSIPAVTFRIAGGAPGGRVSWEVKALRNDRWVQNYGAPVEVEKRDSEKGTYQQPELYGQPRERGIFHRVATGTKS